MNRKKSLKSALRDDENKHSRVSTKGSPTNKETLDLLILIGWTRDILRKIRKKELGPYGITPDKASVLVVIHNLGGSARPNEISPRILRERHSVHELLSRMEKAGLLKRTNNTRRKNGIRVELTEKGHEAYHDVSQRPIVRKILSSLSKEQREELTKSLHILFDAAHTAIEKDHTPDIKPQPYSEI